MSATFVLLGILGAVLIGAISPGPSFVLVVRTSMAVSRRDGLAAALGMGVGAVIFAGVALLGLHTVLRQVGSLYFGLKLLGGFYLIYLAIGLWRGATQPVAVPNTAEQRASDPGKSFSLALATQLSNPKTAVFYASIFAALLPAELPLEISAALPPLVLMVETGWYAVVAFAFSSSRPRAAYLRSRTWIDRIAGSVMGLLGLRLIMEAGRPD
jgi:threonine efflux protein